MKPVKAWALVGVGGDIVRYVLSDDGDPIVLRTQKRAQSRRIGTDRVVRIEIREIPATRKAQKR